LNNDKIRNYQEHYQKLHQHLSSSKHQLPREAESRITRLKLQLSILKKYQRRPIISELISNFGLTVNITGALAPDDITTDGLFELEIWGQVQQIHSSLIYLEQLGLSVLIDASLESDTEDLIY
jgi:hypothetical protein